AAARVGLSQPAMSNALARLRRTFDDSLLVRTPDGMIPTPLAQSMIISVRAALAQLRAALEEKPAFDPSESKRTFHLLANDYAEMVLLSPLLAHLCVRASEIGLHIYRPGGLFQPPSPAALADSFDLALGFFPDALALDPSIHSELLWEEKNVCILRAKHPVIRGAISLKQYAAAHHVAVFYKSQGPGLIDSLLEQRGYSRRQTVLVPHFASVPFMVAATDLIATVPELLPRQFGILKLQVMPVPLAIPPFRLTMLWHERVDRDPAHVWFRGMIAEAAERIRNKRK
ncbi:MAG: LysR family transcriptional regulator, partial [Acidobacteriales bacterium]|nr:LysR family transcriptional regulator [Terriglobales bacterium]